MIFLEKRSQKSSASFNLKAAQKTLEGEQYIQHFFLDLLNSEKSAS